jgi:hypothetical protein
MRDLKGEPILGKRPASLSVRSTIRLNPKLVSGGNMMFNVEIRFDETGRDVLLMIPRGGLAADALQLRQVVLST